MPQRVAALACAADEARCASLATGAISHTCLTRTVQAAACARCRATRLRTADEVRCCHVARDAVLHLLERSALTRELGATALSARSRPRLRARLALDADALVASDERPGRRAALRSATGRPRKDSTLTLEERLRALARARSYRAALSGGWTAPCANAGQRDNCHHPNRFRLIANAPFPQQ
jgi:hypothetical protein